MKFHLSSGYLYPLGSAICYGVSSVLIRQGVSSGLASPLVGATIALLSGSIALLPQTVSNARAFAKSPKQAYVFFLLAGLAASVGTISNFYALRYAPVGVVAPLTSISPLVTILLARFFLKELEKVTLRVVVGSGLVVLGVAIISFQAALD